MLKSIGVKNLRGFNNPAEINLRPITILVGENSSGKSTFARLFPLFRQSIEADSTGPISWFGKYVDMGSHKESLNRTSITDEILFKFSMEGCAFYDMFQGNIDPFNVEIEITTTPNIAGSKTVSATINLVDFDCIYRCSFGSEGKSCIEVLSGGLTFDLNGLSSSHLDSYSLLPFLGMQNLENSYSIDGLGEHYRINLDEEGLSKWAYDEIRSTIDKYTNKTIGAPQLIPMLKVLEGKYLPRWARLKRLPALAKNKSAMERFEVLRRIYQYNFVANAINDCFRRLFADSKYIGPLRMQSERFYRFQDVKSNEIDHLGTNLSMCLFSLTEEELESLNSWLCENFDFSLTTKADGAHFSIYIESYGMRNNIQDMGFGFTQLLPIIISIWQGSWPYLSQKKEKKSSRFISFKHEAPAESIFSIEQPELHLHPKLQYKFGLMLARLIAIANKSRLNIKFVIETHSQHIIEAIGEVISEGELGIKKDDVSVHVFERDSVGDISISESRFDNDGYLTDWPVGFFSGR